jgi:hypothetical protein
MYFWMAPHQASNLFGFTDFGNMNTRYALQPGRDVDSVEYSFTLGKPFIKYQKYPDDLRLKKYKNLGNSTRGGMFLVGYLPYYNDSAKLVKSNRAIPFLPVSRLAGLRTWLPDRCLQIRSQI